LLFVFSAVIGIQIEDAMRAAATTKSDPRWILQIALAILDLLEGFVLTLVLGRGIVQIQALSSPHLESPFQKPYLGSFFAEYFRMLSQVLLYSLLLLLPGLYRYARLIFVPFVALFSRQYHRDRLDALRASEALSKGQMGRIFSTILGMILVTGAFEFAPHMLDLGDVYLARLAFLLMGYAVSIYAFSLIFLLFEANVHRLDDDDEASCKP